MPPKGTRQSLETRERMRKPKSLAHRRNISIGQTKHGHASKSDKTATYICWQNMRRRCTATSPKFSYYGARGIKVCERWQVFENFLVDMGECPEGLMIDRKDNDGDYEPGNCRWVTRSVQMKNRRPWKVRR